MATTKKTKKTKKKDEKPRDPKTLADPFVYSAACEVRDVGTIDDAGWVFRGRHRPTRSLDALISLGYVRPYGETGRGGVEITKEGRKAVDAERKRRFAAGVQG